MLPSSIKTQMWKYTEVGKAAEIIIRVSLEGAAFHIRYLVSLPRFCTFYRPRRIAGDLRATLL